MQSRTPVRNNLYISHPALAKEWHPTKNGSLTPRDVTFIANRKVWWLCSNNHVWSATINERLRGSACPYCSSAKGDEEKITPASQPSQIQESDQTLEEILESKRIRKYSKKKLSPETCLSTVNPALAKEWHPTKNGRLTPQDVMPSSHIQIWWKCPNGHEWKAPISSRNSGQGCFFCNYIHRHKHM